MISKFESLYIILMKWFSQKFAHGMALPCANGKFCENLFTRNQITAKQIFYLIEIRNKMFLKWADAWQSNNHSGETDEANCSWLHPVWPPPKRPDQDSTFCAVNRASTELIFCIHRDFDVRNNVCKPRWLVWECCRDISAWKLGVMKQTVFRDAGRMKPTEYRDEANWFSNWADYANCW